MHFCRMNYFVTAIGTDSGKTLISAILVEALKADYWKPVQAGYPRDTETVQSLISNDKSRFYNERHLLKTPASPHAAAKIDEVDVQLGDFVPPISNRDLIIEGAGGVMVPLNDQDNIIDLVPKFDAEIILVSNLYLGSINHTLLTVEYLKSRRLPVRGIIFNGEANPESEDIILRRSGYDCLLHLPKIGGVTKGTVLEYAEKLSKRFGNE